MSITTHKYTPESWLTVRIETNESSKFVTIVSTIHVNKEFTLPHSYSLNWSDSAILRDRDFLKYYERFR